ncbi:MAG: glycosyltransferase family 4 protein, partial [Firmicutes bacterium]|nr:glycosyltransferase family 4 protein [Bacillota bacterium]
AMAGQAPVVVSDIGGFAETVQHGHNGLTFYAGNSNSLADTILHLLGDRVYARNLSTQASKDVREKYDWNQIALQTVAGYDLHQKLQRESDVVFHRYHVTSDFPERGHYLESSNHGRR